MRPRHLTHLVVTTLVVATAITVRPVAESSESTEESALVPPPVVTPQRSQPEALVAVTLPNPQEEAPVPQSVASRWKDAGLPAPASQQPSEATQKPRTPFKYTVAQGDTVSGIAERFGVSVETVMWANNLSDPNSLQIGDELLILPVSGVLHTVAIGDSINDLAMLYDVSPESIVEFNHLSDPNVLKVGEKLVVPNGKIQMARASVSSRGGRGAQAVGAAGATGSFQWPTAGSITQYFGQAGHTGIDIATQAGSPVYAADGGLVVTALKLGYGYGWHLVVDHGNGYQTLYAHLSAFYADYGERVTKGQRIGSVGSTGLSTGPHLHFEVLQNGTRVNPLKFLP